MTEFELPDDKKPEVAFSEIGSPIYYHKLQDRSLEPPTFGNQQVLERIQTHIHAHIGNADMVFHEIISELIHLDIHWIQPTTERPYHTFVTSGMSDRPMNVPQGAESLRYAELMLSLPEEWEVGLEAFKDENNYWPIRLLKQAARFPHEYKTWLGLYHTLGGDPPLPYASQTKMCCALVFRPILLEETFWELQLEADHTIQFYSLVPIYAEERDFKMKHGGVALMQKLMQQGYAELLDPQRPNVILDPPDMTFLT